ncbi:hypothetical protein [Weissella hellenica]|uniref:hypothetical protein n=1 Tax=Weissella hellenica TaxID=46256 RepID=UPI003885ABD4
MKFVSVILSVSNVINKTITGFIPQQGLFISKHVSVSSDQQKIADDWNKVGNDMRKAIVKYNAGLSK